MAQDIEAVAVALAPMDAEGVELFVHEMCSPGGTGEFQWFGYPTHSKIARLESQLKDGGFLSDEGGMLAVRVEGRSVGRVEWFASAWGRPSTSPCWTIAIGILEDYRGRGIGSAAQSMLVDYLFAHTTMHRIQAYTDAENLAERGALARAGFEEEGILRSAQWRAGAWHDVVLFSRLRDS